MDMASAIAAMNKFPVNKFPMMVWTCIDLGVHSDNDLIYCKTLNFATSSTLQSTLSGHVDEIDIGVNANNSFRSATATRLLMPQKEGRMLEKMRKLYLSLHLSMWP